MTAVPRRTQWQPRARTNGLLGPQLQPAGILRPSQAPSFCSTPQEFLCKAMPCYKKWVLQTQSHVHLEYTSSSEDAGRLPFRRCKICIWCRLRNSAYCGITPTDVCYCRPVKAKLYTAINSLSANHASLKTLYLAYSCHSGVFKRQVWRFVIVWFWYAYTQAYQYSATLSYLGSLQCV